MTQASRRRKFRWLRHVAWVTLVTIFLAVAAVAFFFGTGLGNPLLRRVVVRRLEALTGARVQLRTISVGWFSLRATLKGLELHGLEPAGTEPLFSAEEVQAGLRIDSFWGRKVALDGVFVREPRIHIRVGKDGKTNVPVVYRPRSAKPLGQTLLDLHIKHLKIENGWILYNEVKSPLAVEGDRLRLVVDASGPLENLIYVGNLVWQDVTFTTKSFVPVPVGISAKFSFSRDKFTLEQGVVNAAHSHVDTQAELTNFADPKWNVKYRGWVELGDLRETLRQPLVPTGRADVRGEGTFADGKFRGTGNYAGRDIALPYDDFHAGGVTSHGNFRIDNDGLVVPDFFAGALGGTVRGRVTLRFAGLQFRAETHVQDVRLAALLPVDRTPRISD